MIAAGESVKSEPPERVHVPVLLQEVLDTFRGERAPGELEGWIVDGTVGAGGHARALLETFPLVRVFGVDQDPEVLAHARGELLPFGGRARLERARISGLHPLLAAAGIEPVIGFLLDLGANSLHFDRPERGFSLQKDGPLDMRMDPGLTRTAADIVNRWDEEDLADLFFYEGDERHSRAIARAIVQSRARVPFTRTVPLADVIAQALGGHPGGRIHPATRCFQALRRAVNEEGDELRHGLRIAERVLVEGGRLVVITFHSLEDGFVRKFLQERAREGAWQLVNKKPLGPGATERRANPRARSALLRGAVRTRAPEELACGPEFPETEASEPIVPEIDLPDRRGHRGEGG
jgi:16S rRNA (cytosine1402-N4)-methyltransferase